MYLHTLIDKVFANWAGWCVPPTPSKLLAVSFGPERKTLMIYIALPWG